MKRDVYVVGRKAKIEMLLETQLTIFTSSGQKKEKKCVYFCVSYSKLTHLCFSFFVTKLNF